MLGHCLASALPQNHIRRIEISKKKNVFSKNYPFTFNLFFSRAQYVQIHN